MKSFKRAIWRVILIDIIFSYTLAALSTRSFVEPFFELAFWCLPLLIIVPAFLISMLIIVLFYKEGREGKTQFYCQLGGLLIAVSIFFYGQVGQLISQQQSNYIAIKDIPKELNKALKVLNKHFDSTTKATALSYWVLNEETDSAKGDKWKFAIYFTYYLNGDSSREYFSKLIPQDSSYLLKVFNGSPEFDFELKQLRQKIDEPLQGFNDR
ncbi:hypothetical protein [Flavisolibacter tropicus]|uniref:Uncharacterized protein n=1 Tax=Flavisolibacter tropicus TaxID=1492898 RepID=A0A172TVG8_9BACT|nr:hypothetical protein [Flavisolibacter tropicus]ANE50874.1 hypothetical protein SY85_10535 [Flavisolibacter tropicus]